MASPDGSVWIVQFGDSYEGFSIEAIFDNQLSAIEYMEQAQKVTRFGDYLLVHHGVRSVNTHRAERMWEVTLDVRTGSITSSYFCNYELLDKPSRVVYLPAEKIHHRHNTLIAKSSISDDDARELATKAFAEWSQTVNKAPE